MKYLSYIVLLMIIAGSSCFARNNNVTLLQNLNDYGNYTDCWGYTAPDGREYALLGLSGGVSIVDVSDPSAIAEADFAPWVNGGWYDMKTYQQYMYVSTESSSNILLVDLANLPASASVIGTFGSLASGLHNIYIDQQAALLYAVEDFHFNKPITIFSLADPLNPVEVGSLAGLANDSHDIFVQNGRAYLAEGSSPTIAVFDVSDPSDPLLLQRIVIPAAGYVHNVWATPDDSYMLTTEETAGKTIKMWDIQDLSNATIVDEYIGESTLAHNVFIKGDFAYISHYQSGVKILDISDPTSIVEVGNYDTIAGEQPVTFGNWGVYPFAQNGLIYASDMVSGLYVLEFNNTRAYHFSGILTDSQSGAPIADGWIEVLETGSISRSDGGGNFSGGVGVNGTINLRVGALGYTFLETTLTAVPGESDTLALQLTPSARSTIRGILRNENAAALPGEVIVLTRESKFLSAPQQLRDTTASDGSYVFSGLPVSDGVWVEYRSIASGKKFPYNARAVGDLLLEANADLVVDFDLQPADLLLVNDSVDDGGSDVYLAALQAAGADAFGWETVLDGGLPVSRLGELQSRSVIWFTGESAGEVLSASERDSLALLLDGGGNLLLSSRAAAEDLTGSDPVFLASYLQVDYGGSAANAPLIQVVAGSPIAAGLGAFTAAQPARDVLIPAAGGSASLALTYLGGAGAGITLDNSSNASRVVFLGFGFEAITNEAERNTLMANVLSWFDVTTGLIPQPDNVPATISLEANYPNPFNPATTIAFQVSARTEIVLSVYNLLGQTIRTLLDGSLTAGRHTVVWDGKDRQGNPVSSGVYLYRLSTPDYALGRKMVLIK